MQKLFFYLFFYVFSLLLLFFLYQTWILLKKEGYMNIYGHFIYGQFYV